MLSLSLSGIARPVKRVVSAADSGLTVSSSFVSCSLSCKYVILPGHEGRKDVPVLLLVLVSVFQRALFLANGGGRMPSESPAGGSPSRLRVQRYGDFFIPPNIMITFFSFRAKKVNDNE